MLMIRYGEARGPAVPSVTASSPPTALRGVRRRGRASSALLQGLPRRSIALRQQALHFMSRIRPQDVAPARDGAGRPPSRSLTRLTTRRRGESDRARPPQSAPVASESGEDTRTRRGRGSAEVVSERDFSELWDLLKGKGWKCMPKPQYIAPGDPRTWMWCAPEIVEPQNDSGYYKLRGRDAGVVGESIFLDKDDLWVWAVRKGLVAAPPAAHTRGL